MSRPAPVIDTVVLSPANPADIPSRSQVSREATWLAWGSFFLYALAAFYLLDKIHYVAGDAASRVGNAYYVLFSRNPHLGAIGFVWNPLPSILELPLVALHPWWPAVVSRGIAGFVISSMMGALSVYHLDRILTTSIPLPRVLRLVAVAAFALNPLIILYGANGMSDIMWVACILGTYSGLLAYLQTGSLRRLIAGGLWLAAGFGMRYEAIPFGLLLILAIAFSRVTPATLRVQARGAAMIFGAPIVFAAGVWIYFNWLIMKNPLYFLNSSYSNLAQTATGAYMTPAVAAADHHLGGSLLYVVRFGAFYWPIYIGVAFALWHSIGRLRDNRAVVLVLGTIGCELLEWALLYKGSLGEWDRYFLEFIPNGILLTAYLVSHIRPRWSKWSRAWKIPAALLTTAIMLSGSAGTVLALQYPSLSAPDGSVIDAAYHGQSLHASGNNPFWHTSTLVQYVNDHPHMTILADTFIAGPVIIQVRHLNQFVITSDYDFNSILFNPKGRVSAFLVPKPAGVAQLDAINRAWPGLWAGHVPWTKLIKEFPGSAQYRLYEILPSAP